MTFIPTSPATPVGGLSAPNPGLNTNSGLGPGPGLVISGPVALIRYNVVGWSPTGSGQYTPPTISPAVGGISMSGIGDFPLTGYNVTGRQGELDVVFTTGTAGTTQHVVALVDKVPTPVGYLGVFLDTQNRPYVVVTDVSGSIVAQTTPLGAAIPAGAVIHAFVEWNSVAAINGPDFVAIEVGEVALENWGKEPATAWTPFQPTILAAGDGFGSYSVLTGSIGNVQIGTGTAVAFNPPQISASHSVACGINASSTMTGHDLAQYKAHSTILATATVAAAATTAGP